MAVEEGASILQTPSYVVAVLLLLFAALFLSFEKLIEWRKQSLKKRNKLALLAAAEAMTTELMLFGIAALLLSVFEDPISKICIPATQGGNWYMISELSGCPCCLQHTHYVTECWAADHTCGPDYCNCNGQDPVCLADETESSLSCTGQEEASEAICGDRPGYKQALSELAIHEIHLHVFWIALIHIVCSSLLIRISTWRLDIWKQWMIGDNAHIKAVHAKLDEHAARLGGQPEQLTGSPAVNPAHSAPESAPNGIDGNALQQAESSSADSRQAGVRSGPSLSAADSMLLSADILNSSSSIAEVMPVRIEGQHVNKDDVQGSSSPQVAINIPLPSEVVVDQQKEWQGRAQVMDKRRTYIREWLTCFVRQFYFHPVTRPEMSIMRASFVLTHRPGKRFVFTDYILAGLDEDFAKVVGLGASAWLIISIFVLLSGLIGWAQAWFALAALVMQLILNTKLVYIARHSTRGGHVHRLERSVFWFGSEGPWVMLVVIKAQLFLVAFIYTSQVFFAANFGPHSCFFSTPGFNSRSLPIPWWGVLLLNTFVYAMLCFVTLPLYSLGVHMGADFKHHILPSPVQQRMLDVAKDAKHRVKQRQQNEQLQQQKKSSGLAAQRWRRRMPRFKLSQ